MYSSYHITIKYDLDIAGYIAQTIRTCIRPLICRITVCSIWFNKITKGVRTRYCFKITPRPT